MVDTIGRRLTIAASCAAAAAAALLFAAAPGGSVGIALLAACLFNGISVSGWNALDAYSAEIVPTSVRTSAIGRMSAAGRLGSISSQLVNGALLQRASWAPLLPGAGVLLLAAAAVLLLLPTETKGRGLEDHHADGVDDGEEASLLPADGL